MASAAGGSGGGQPPNSSCIFCNADHQPERCPVHKSMDSYIFGYRKIRTMLLVARAKNDLLLFKGSKTSKEYSQFRQKKVKELMIIKAKVEADREKLKAFMKATNDLQQCLKIPADNIRRMYQLLGHPDVVAAQQRAIDYNPVLPSSASVSTEQEQGNDRPGVKKIAPGKSENK